MNSVLKSVGWGEPALSLLSQCRKIDHSLPAVMHIRHSERPPITPESVVETSLTDRGREAAFEMGTQLPRYKKYRLFHSASNRAIETAEEIHRGLRSIDAEALMGGVFIHPHNDHEKFVGYLIRDLRSDRTARPFFINWASGQFPPWEMEPYGMFAQRAASVMMKNLEELDSSGFDIYVSHDIWVAPFLFYWFGIMPSIEWIEYLDGFILQLTDDRMSVFTKDGEKEAYYPYWWSF